HPIHKGYAVKLSGNLTYQWHKTFGNLANPANPVTSISTDPSNNVLFGGYFSSIIVKGNVINAGNSTLNGKETFIVSYDASGNYRWFDQTSSPDGTIQYNGTNHAT